MKIVNLTPHPVAIVGDNGQAVRTIDPSGPMVRVETTTRTAEPIEEISVGEVSYGELAGLPDPEEDTVYLVSVLALQVAHRQGRKDVFSPDTGPESAVRDDKGMIIGVKRLMRYSEEER